MKFQNEYPSNIYVPRVGDADQEVEKLTQIQVYNSACESWQQIKERNIQKFS